MRYSSIFALMIAAATVSTAARAEIILPGDLVAGLSQSELSARWSKWAFSYPDGANPLQDTTGALSYLGDQGSYFFLAGTFDPVAVTRSATVFSDQYLFIPLAYALAMIPMFGDTEAAIRQDAADTMGVVSNLSLKINGVEQPLPPPTTSLLDYLQTSPPGTFGVDFPAGAVFGIPEGTYQSVSVGYWIALKPLAPGNYQLHFTSRSDSTGPYQGDVYTQDVTYNLTVAVPEPAGVVLAGIAVLTIGACRMRRAVS